MAQDVIVRGVTYTGVEKLNLPISGGSALFRDTSAADAAASDIVRGKTAYGANGLITGTHDLPSGGISITQNGTVDVTDYATALVNVQGGGGQTVLCSIDFSKVVDAFTLNGVSISSAGAVFTGNTNCFVLPLTRNGMTVEIDFGTINPSSGTNNRRLLNPRGTSNGLIFHYQTGFWSLYNGSWHDSTITGMDAFANSTLKVEIDSSGYWHIYKNGVLLYDSNSVLNVNGNVALQIGSDATNALNEMTVLAVRVY